MIRLLFLLFIVTGVLGVVAINPRPLLSAIARLWYWIARGTSASPQVPEWVAYYLWTAPGDPVPSSVKELEGTIRMMAVFVLLAPFVLLLVTVLSSP